MSDLTMNILGFSAVTPDLEVEVRDSSTQALLRTVKPFLDGTVRVPKIDPGAYEVLIKHPNLALPVIRRPIRVLPVGNTNVTVLIDPAKFRNTPIEDIPEANLTPVIDLAASVGETVLPLSNKVPGEAIRSADWNALAGAVRDLSTTTGELARLVAPNGHDHPELIAKINEMQTNFTTLLDTLSKSMAELQRQIQSLRLRQQVESVLDKAEIAPGSSRGKQIIGLLDKLDDNVTETPVVYARETRKAAQQLGLELETLIDERADKPDFIDSEPVKDFSKAVEFLKQNRSSDYGAEMQRNSNSARSLGGSLTGVFKARPS